MLGEFSKTSILVSSILVSSPNPQGLMEYPT
jgi:hypothetical protein